MPDKGGGNLKEFGVLEANYHTARRKLTDAANKPNFFYLLIPKKVLKSLMGISAPCDEQ